MTYRRRRHRPRLLPVVVLLVGLPSLPCVAPAMSMQAEARLDSLERHGEYLAAFCLATTELEQASRQADAGALAAPLLGRIAMIAGRCGHWGMAEEMARLVMMMQEMEFGDRSLEYAEARLRWGRLVRVTRHANRYDDSWIVMQDVRCIMEERHETAGVVYGDVIFSEGNWRRWRDRPRSASDMIKALDIYQNAMETPSTYSAGSQTWLGWTLLHIGEHEMARVYLERAEQEWQQLGLADDAGMATVLSALGDLAVLDEDWAQAEGFYRRAAELYELNRVRKGLTTREAPLHGYNLLALTQVKQGKFDDAWRSVQRYRGQASRAALESSNVGAMGDPDYMRLIELREESLPSAVMARAIDEAPALSVSTLRQLARHLRVVAERDSLENVIVQRHPIPRPTVQDLTGTLPPQTVYIGWLDARIANDLLASSGPVLYSRWAYRVQSGHEVVWEPLLETSDPREDHAERARLWIYGGTIDRASAWRERVPDDPQLREVGRDLHDGLIGGLLDGVDADHLVAEFFSENGSVPVNGLVCPDGAYLGEHFSVSLSPSAAVYVTLRNRSRGAARHPSVLAIGDPVFSDDTTRASTGRIDVTLLRSAINRDPSALGSLPRLPHAGDEVQHIAALFPGTRVLQGADANEPSLWNLVKGGRLADYDIIHVASHALVDILPDRCAIALSRLDVDATDSANDGLLDANEIRFGWRLDADLVTLSGCQTAGGMWLRGEPVGFVQDLFAAGARCVLVSLWKVDDLATSMLMARFYQNLAAQREPAGQPSPGSMDDALAEAKAWMRNYQDASGGHPFAHPVYWSGFVLIGSAN